MLNEYILLQHCVMNVGKSITNNLLSQNPAETQYSQFDLTFTFRSNTSTQEKIVVMNRLIDHF